MALEISGGESLSPVISFKQIQSVYKKEYIQWITNPKMIVCFVLLVMIREVVILPMTEAASQMDQPLNVLEPIIAAMNSGIILLLIPLAYLVLIADFPCIDGNTYYYLSRVGRLNWFFGQIAFQLGSIITYLLFVVISTGIQVSGESFLINGWSLVVTDRGEPFDNGVMDNLIPLSLFYQMSPYQAFLMSFLFLALFLMLVNSVMLFASLYGRKTIAFWGIMISVTIGIVFCAFKSKWMWLFPISHAILWIHYQDYYREYIFSPWASAVLLIAANLLVFAGMVYKVRHVNLDILREVHEV